MCSSSAECRLHVVRGHREKPGRPARFSKHSGCSCQQKRELRTWLCPVKSMHIGTVGPPGLALFRETKIQTSPQVYTFPKKSGTSKVLAIVLPVVAAFIVLVAVAGGVLFYWKERRQARKVAMAKDEVGLDLVDEPYKHISIISEAGFDRRFLIPMKRLQRPQGVDDVLGQGRADKTHIRRQFRLRLPRNIQAEFG